MPLLIAMTDIIDQIENRHFKRIIVDIKEKLKKVHLFQLSYQAYQCIFRHVHKYVRVGENMGSLDQVIERLADMEERKTY